MGLFSLNILFSKGRPRGDILGNSFFARAYARAYVRINNKRENSLVRCTWYTNTDHVDIYPWEPFLSNFIFCRYIWTHKLWKDKIYNKKDAYLIENVSIAWSHEVHLGFPLNKMHAKCPHNLLVNFTIITGGIHGNWTCFTHHLPFNFSFLRNLCLFLSFLMPASEKQTRRRTKRSTCQ